MVQKFLSRPVLSTVISILICILGVLGYISLPVEQFPNIAPPMVRVSANFPGANAQTVLRSVVTPLEEQINGVEGMTYMVSNATNNGSASISVYFDLSTDPNMAQVNVQNRVSAALSQLPTTVTQNGVTTRKMMNNQLLVASLYSNNPKFDQTFLQNYARINIAPELERVNGVGQVNIFGSRNYSMRIWLDPVKMASYKLMPSDVISAVQEQNVEAAPGQLGLNGNQQFQYTLTYKGKFTEVPDYENIVIKANDDGRILKLKDVARVELGGYDYTVDTKVNGREGVGMSVYQMAGSNARDVVDALKAKLETLSKRFPPGVKYAIPNDANKFLEASIHKVKRTFIEAFILVFFVVFLFLQNWRSTLIPGISALVAIIGTFFVLNLLGFSLNLLTLFALVLAIGIVVDDAIVVVEAVHAKMDHDESLSTVQATSKAMDEIWRAIISITLVMAFVFIPVSFMSGPAGTFYRQFGLTLAVAITLSAINALTLSPVLCTFFIKRASNEEEKKSFISRLHANFNVAFDATVYKYKKSLSLFTKHRWIPVAVIVTFALGAYLLIKITPTAFVPNEDQGMISADVTLPPGASLERTKSVMKQIDSTMNVSDLFAARMSIAGQSMLSGTNGSSHGMMTCSLVPWEQRGDTSTTDVIEMLNKKTGKIKEGKIIFYAPPPIRGFGSSDGFEVQVEDKTGGDITKFYQVVKDFMSNLSARPEIDFVNSSFNVNFPQYQFDIQVDKCKMEGVAINDVFQALQAYYGGMMVSDFNRYTKYCRVVMQAAPEDRTDLNSLTKVMVRNKSGKMVPITTLINFSKVYRPETITRYDLFTAATVQGKQKKGFSSGDAIAAVREEASKLPVGYEIEFSGMSREEIKSGSQAIYIFILCFLFVYFVLCAQYESYMLPLSVMLSLTIGVFGVFMFINIFGITNNIYVQVSLIMLIGLLGKNGILIVEFARQRREHGMGIVEAAIEGATARLRPILMTSFAFIFGMMPLILETGAGRSGNNSIGVAAAGGMLIGTLFGIFVIPTMYIIFENLDEKIRRKKWRN
ncbi:efflux RND transporter permease subunit [Paludibacter jiangxiensis]|uniref:Hydrophobic/amphiphilic exporter-1, HAE1 family n=1 Tax=Paludibacter jiangxiensis TaxID=681398 RepID=A0A171AAT4_9BACT|nr:efflux RND transporter permease subunit [Paludibacter jiangxiensis]GAT63461.1 hydrophobic/amphiphilic exporter-1, HAE1 family [Paludibacter jiangxiensis]